VILLLLMFWVNVSGNLKFFFSVILVVFIYLSVVSPPHIQCYFALRILFAQWWIKTIN